MSQESLFIVTGASGGYGSAILRQVDTNYGSRAAIIATTRDVSKINCSKFRAQIKPVVLDLSTKNNLEDKCNEACSAFKDKSFKNMTLFNNHGSLNDVEKTLVEFSENEITDYIHLNITSFQVLTSCFIKTFKSTGAKLTVVNISSLAAIQPFCGFGLYSGGKAARMLLYKVLAAENPEISVLNYSPGPMKTSMTEDLMTTGIFTSTSEVFRQLEESKRWVDVDVSAAKMMTILKEGKYESGVQIDFFDRE